MRMLKLVLQITKIKNELAKWLVSGKVRQDGKRFLPPIPNMNEAVGKESSAATSLTHGVFHHTFISTRPAMTWASGCKANTDSSIFDCMLPYFEAFALLTWEKINEKDTDEMPTGLNSSCECKIISIFVGMSRC